MTEFEIRRKMEVIRLSDQPPVKKAKELLRLRRLLSIQLAEIEQARAQVGRSTDVCTKAMFTRMVANAESLKDDVSESARHALEGRARR